MSCSEPTGQYARVIRKTAENLKAMAVDVPALIHELADVLKRTIREDMREESTYLRSHAMARNAIKDIIEIPALLEDGVWDAIRLAIDNAFPRHLPRT